MEPDGRDRAAAELLSGPRGRRLCLLLAGRAGYDVSVALMQLAQELDPQPGSTRTIALARISDGELPPRPDPMSVEEFARLLPYRASGALTAEEIGNALDEAVGNARYWQPPDGEDVLAAHPAVRTALEPVARALLSSSHTADWQDPAALRQWRVAWDGSRPRGLPVPQLLQEWADHTRADEHRSRSQRDADPHARYSGEWWSVPAGLPNSVGVGPRGFDLVEDHLGWVAATVIPLDLEGRRVLELRTAQDWAALCREHPLDVSASRRHDWFRVTDRDGAWVLPDWQAVSAEWDAVHLSVSAYLALAGRVIPIDDERASLIAGWSPDTTFWLSEPPRSDAPAEQWRRGDSGGGWMRVR